VRARRQALLSSCWPCPVPAAAGGCVTGGGASSWGAINGLASSLLLHLTASVRFEGSLNTDLSDLTVNLVRTSGSCAMLCGGSTHWPVAFNFERERVRSLTHTHTHTHTFACPDPCKRISIAGRLSLRKPPPPPPRCWQVPFPRMHFLLSSLAPLAAPRDVGRLNTARSVDQVRWCLCWPGQAGGMQTMLNTADTAAFMRGRAHRRCLAARHRRSCSATRLRHTASCWPPTRASTRCWRRR